MEETNKDAFDKGFDVSNKITEKNNGKFFELGHHKSHAANAFFSSNFDEALIVTMDGGGAEEDGTITAFTVWTGKDTKINEVEVIPIGKTFITWDIVYMQIIIATTHTNEGTNFVKPSVALRVPVEIISPAIAIANNTYAWAKVIVAYTFWQNKDLVLS